MEEFSKSLISVLLGLTMMPLHNPEREEENPKGNTLHLLSRGGTVPQSCCCSYGNTQQLLTCGELGEFSIPASQVYYLLIPCSCVFGEMFKGKPILAGNSDLNQAELIFNLVGTPNEENMPGWSQLPGCEGVKNFGIKRGNLHNFFKEYVTCFPLRRLGP
jgi:hypothetical protein